MSTPTPAKSERIDVRASGPVKQLLQEAARACHKNVSEFLLDAGVTAATQALADRRRFDAFDCGQTALKQFLQRHALVNQKANSAQSYVCCQGHAMVGFCSLAVGSVDPKDAPSRIMKGLAWHPVPAMILARLAVDKEHQPRGLGRALLKDALLRTAQAADIALLPDN